MAPFNNDMKPFCHETESNLTKGKSMNDKTNTDSSVRSKPSKPKEQKDLKSRER